MPRDPYAVLGVARDATPTEIKAAFRALAMKYHPDRNPGDKTAEASFREAAAAYEVLSDPVKRQTHDWTAREEDEPQERARPSWHETFERLARDVLGEAADRVASHAADKLTGAGRMEPLRRGEVIVRHLPCADGQVCVEVRCRIEDVGGTRRRQRILEAVERALLE